MVSASRTPRDHATTIDECRPWRTGIPVGAFIYMQYAVKVGPCLQMGIFKKCFEDKAMM